AVQGLLQIPPPPVGNGLADQRIHVARLDLEDFVEEAQRLRVVPARARDQRAGVRRAGLGGSVFGVRITGAGLGGGGGADGLGGGGSTKLEVIRSARARAGASGIGADGSYNRSPESISAADRRLVTFVRSRIGRRTTHQPIWTA